MVKKLVLGASIGNCVHVAGVSHFLNIAEDEGFDTIFLGPAVSVKKLFEDINFYRPYMIAVGYRLTPQNVIPLLDEITERRKALKNSPIWVFGGTKQVAEIAKKYNFFSYISDGTDDIIDSIRYLRGETSVGSKAIYADNLIDRVRQSYPYPLLRHHYGEPKLDITIEGVEKIAEAGVLDIISIGPDQNAQQYFFDQKKMKKEFDGAGGVPLRSRADLKKLRTAAQRGNYPLLRCYSGTENVFDYAKMLVKDIDNAWAAIPLSWYNELDGRGTRSIEKSISEAQRLMHWHAERKIPVEVNEPHQWALRDAHDVISVATAYIGALNAKKAGVENYIAQYMFNVPNGLTFSMDLARILAMKELVESLEDASFKIYRETRAGLPLFNSDADIAKGQLATSTFLQMVIKPHIVHVVGFCEADHAASADDVIASCKIVKGVIRHTLGDEYSIEKDERIQKRKNELIREVQYLLHFICNKYRDVHSPLTDAGVLAECIRLGIIDAVHIAKNDKFQGNLYTKIIDGRCVAFDKLQNRELGERERLELLMDYHKRQELQKDRRDIS